MLVVLVLVVLLGVVICYEPICTISLQSDFFFNYYFLSPGSFLAKNRVIPLLHWDSLLLVWSGAMFTSLNIAIDFIYYIEIYFWIV
jgi:hypothetical protein